jgi:hypothetical protein
MFRNASMIIVIFFVSAICLFPQAAGLRASVAVLENRSMADSTTSFGSCFLWIDPRTNENFLVSCEHVVRDAHHLAATFQDKNGDTLYLDSIETVFTDKRRDLALLSIGKGSRNGLKISLSPVEEGMTEVWSAGFPALGNISPIFQLSRGHVTNEAVRILPHGEFLQHDANVSAASSGGPLVTSVKTVDVLTASEVFAVVGVNAVTARGRANTSYAIPSPAVASFIERALRHVSEEDMWEEENNDTRDSATVIQLDAEINGTLNPLYDEDWYRLDIPEKTDAVLVVKGNGNFSVEVSNLAGEAVRTVKGSDGFIQFQMVEAEPVFIRVKQQAPFFDVYNLKVTEK